MSNIQLLLTVDSFVYTEDFNFWVYQLVKS